MTSPAKKKPARRPDWKRSGIGPHTSATFDYTLDFAATDYRAHPELYRVGRGEEGVLLVEPYKGEVLPHWRFKTQAEARKSAAAIRRLYRGYKAAGDFVGMDMARKFLQMGYTRARRYANHTGGRKYAADGTVLPYRNDPVKAEAAALFKAAWAAVKADPAYVRMKAAHLERYGK